MGAVGGQFAETLGRRQLQALCCIGNQDRCSGTAVSGGPTIGAAEGQGRDERGYRAGQRNSIDIGWRVGAMKRVPRSVLSAAITRENNQVEIAVSFLQAPPRWE